MPQLDPFSDRAVRDTVAAVFRQRPYDRGIVQSFLDRAMHWVWELLGAEFRAVAGSPAARWALFGVTIAIVVAIVIHMLVSRVGLGDSAERRDGQRRPEWAGGDPWALAQRLAGAGNYTDAAHALYRALLQAVARREQVRIDPAKTTGDYVRDLRRRSSALVTPFRDFARTYEVVVYGLGVCDRPRYERLLTLASAITGGGAYDGG